ncbi:MAG: hypothetical protein D6813_09885 [Calditrichaeota bacterium]|nr:MAG: hypothetical protein D6813_09885 [Calditrichota bacterium]
MMKLFRTFHTNFKEAAKKEIELLRSSKISIEKLRTVCLTLGPYRNLTTLTAAIVALHPNCQVLNHAGGRIFNDKRLNFFLEYSQNKFDRFVKYAIYISQGGREGPYGGSILYSHAFGSQHRLSEIYRKLYGNSRIKDNIHCLFWKESMPTSSFIRDYQVDLDAILTQNQALRFLMPIRNPLDCAVSNLKFFGNTKQLHQVFRLKNRQEVLYEVMESILDEFQWFLELKRQNPERFFCYFEYEFGEKTLLDLAKFLNIGADKQWLRNSMEAWEMKSRYKHPDEFVEFYNQQVEQKFSNYPDFANKLLHFTRDYERVG